jgi:uncharacterized delta-60 repeat protein
MFTLKPLGMKPIYLLVVLFFPLSLFAQLDNGFGSEGRALVNFQKPSAGGPSLIQPADQKILTSGTCYVGTTLYYYIARFTTDGNLDPSFNGIGVVLIPFNLGYIGTPYLALQSTGNIILAGQALNSIQAVVLVRVTPTGQIDYSFNSAGYTYCNSLIGLDGLLVQSDDKIVIGGAVDDGNGIGVARFTKDGVADPTFATNGLFTTDGVQCQAIGFLNDGSIIAAGPTWTGNEAFHLSTTGVLDTHFGTRGYASLTVGDGDQLTIQGITVIENNYIIIVGSYLPDVKNGNWRFLAIELTPLGQYNPAFAGNGKLGIPFAGYNAGAAGCVETWGGRLVLAGGLTKSGSPTQIGLARVLNNGAIDYAFGPNGTQTTSWWTSSYSVAGMSIALQKDAKIVVGADLGAHGMGVVRYLNPIILPPPPVVNSEQAALANGNASLSAGVTRIFPNPAGSTLNIQGMNGDEKAILLITDAAGRTVLTARPGGLTAMSLDISSLAAGAYFLTVSTPAKRLTLPFVKGR